MVDIGLDNIAISDACRMAGWRMPAVQLQHSLELQWFQFQSLAKHSCTLASIPPPFKKRCNFCLSSFLLCALCRQASVANWSLAQHYVELWTQPADHNCPVWSSTPAISLHP